MAAFRPGSRLLSKGQSFRASPYLPHLFCFHFTHPLAARPDRAVHTWHHALLNEYLWGRQDGLVQCFHEHDDEDGAGGAEVGQVSLRLRFHGFRFSAHPSGSKRNTREIVPRCRGRWVEALSAEVKRSTATKSPGAILDARSAPRRGERVKRANQSLPLRQTTRQCARSSVG